MAGTKEHLWPWGGAPARESLLNYKTQARGFNLVHLLTTLFFFLSSPLFYPKTTPLGEIHKEETGYSWLAWQGTERQRSNAHTDFSPGICTKYIEIN